MHILPSSSAAKTLAFFKQSHLLRSASSALALFIASALLGGCASTGSQLAPAGTTYQSPVQPNFNTNAGSAKPFISQNPSRTFRWGTTPASSHGTLSGEILAASNVTVKTTTCIGGRYWDHDASFTARGKSTGPYPGGFVAKGSWSGAASAYFAYWDFSETFTITSRKRSISGTIEGSGKFIGYWFLVGCKALGPVSKDFGRFNDGYLGYTSGSWSGPVTIPREIRNGFLEEKLH